MNEQTTELKYPLTFQALAEDSGKRLDQFLVSNLPDTSRVRIQQQIADGKVLVDGIVEKPSLRLRGKELVKVLGPAIAPPLRAIPEEIPLDIVYEDSDLAVVNKPAGMMVHAGAGSTEDARNRGTLVNALLHRFETLSGVGGELRPGIVHRLDKDTSGLIVVAKNDVAHRKLGEQFASREVRKKYIALVHGLLKQDRGTINSSISRDRVRRTRMTTRRIGGREAVSHYQVLERFASEFGKFSLVEVKIDTGRTHQIRVHLSSLGHPIVGDTLYGAPREIVASNDPRLRTRTKKTVHTAAGGKKKCVPGDKAIEAKNTAALGRNFLHAAAIELVHPRTGSPLSFSRPLPPELERFLVMVRGTH